MYISSFCTLHLTFLKLFFGFKTYWLTHRYWYSFLKLFLYWTVIECLFTKRGKGGEKKLCLFASHSDLFSPLFLPLCIFRMCCVSGLVQCWSWTASLVPYFVEEKFETEALKPWKLGILHQGVCSVVSFLPGLIPRSVTFWAQCWFWIKEEELLSSELAGCWFSFSAAWPSSSWNFWTSGSECSAFCSSTCGCSACCWRG